MYIYFLFLVARPGQIDAVQHALFDVALPLHLVKEIFRKVRIAEEQPVFARCFIRRALLQEGAERCDAGTRTNHNHRRFRISRQAEVVVVLNKHPHFALFFDAIGEEARCSTGARAAFDIKAYRADGDMHFALDFRLR
ncbi:hypothetical protein D3C86_1687530 [compost metagenome]